MTRLRVSDLPDETVSEAIPNSLVHWPMLRDVLATEWWNTRIAQDPIAAGIAAMLLHARGPHSCIDDAMRRARRAMQYAHSARAAESDGLSALGDAIVASYFTAKAVSGETRDGGWTGNPTLAAALRRKVDRLHGHG